MNRISFTACIFAALISNAAAQAQTQNVYSGTLTRLAITGNDGGKPQSFMIIPTLTGDPAHRVCNAPPEEHAHAFRVANRYEREKTQAGKRRAIRDQSTAVRLLVDAYFKGELVKIIYRCNSTDRPLVSSIQTTAGVLKIPIDDIPY